MLTLCAAHLRVLRVKSSSRLVWVDIGGGTGGCTAPIIAHFTQRDEGYNIEEMDKYFPIDSFDHVYLVDLCESLLQVARERFARRGWKNVTVLCQDATSFILPEWKGVSGSTIQGSVSFVTLSYSLSMVGSFTDFISYRLLFRLLHH
jgi:betaine lipid synthase